MQKIRRIAINATMLDEKPTGVGIYSLNIINGLKKVFDVLDVVEIEVFGATSKGLDHSIKFNKVTNWVKNSKFGRFSSFYRLFWNFFFLGIRTKKYDLVFNLTAHGSLFLSNQITVIHDILSLKMKNVNTLQGIYYTYFLPILARKSHYIITDSNASLNDIVSYLKISEQKIIVIPCGYDKILFRPIINAPKLIKDKYNFNHFLLAVGPSYVHKNFEFLIRAYLKLSDEQRKIFPLLILGGRKQYIKQLKRLIKELGGKNGIHFLGYVPIEELPFFYNAATGLIFPSLFEGFGLPPLEAMACGCPIICSNVSSMPEVCGDAAVYFNPFNLEDLENAIKLIIKEPTIRKDFIERGLIRAKEFSWEITSKKTAKVILEFFK